MKEKIRTPFGEGISVPFELTFVNDLIDDYKSFTLLTVSRYCSWKKP
jgi:hypothetical protein